MIDFKEELLKFKPATEMKDVEDAIGACEMQDIMDILKQFSEQIKKN